MNWRAIAYRTVSLGVVIGLAATYWLVTSPGVLTFTEWRVLLLVGGICLIITLSATWVSKGRPPVDYRGKRHG